MNTQHEQKETNICASAHFLKKGNLFCNWKTYLYWYFNCNDSLWNKSNTIFFHYCYFIFYFNL